MHTFRPRRSATADGDSQAFPTDHQRSRCCASDYDGGPSDIRSGLPAAAAATAAAGTCPGGRALAATRAGGRERPFSSPIDSGAATGGTRGMLGTADSASVSGTGNATGRRDAMYARGRRRPETCAMGTLCWIARIPADGDRRRGAGAGSDPEGDAIAAFPLNGAGPPGATTGRESASSIRSLSSCCATRGIAAGMGSLRSSGMVTSTTLLEARGGSITATAARALRAGIAAETPLHAQPSRGARSIRVHWWESRCWARSMR